LRTALACDLIGLCKAYTSLMTSLTTAAPAVLDDLTVAGAKCLPGMTDRQLSLPFPAAEVRCRTCDGKDDVYYLAGRPNVVGGKRVVCPVCAGAGRVRVPTSANEQPG